MKTEKVTCDECGRDLTTTGNERDYRIVLMSERIPATSGSVTAMMVYPQLERPLHFCGIKCLVNNLKVKIEKCY